MEFMDAVKASTELVKLLRKEPDEKFFHLTFVVGHGMHFEKSLCILLNDFDKYKGFYKLYAVETEVRKWSDVCRNCYFVAIFACCREAFLHKFHCDCVGANSLAEAKQKFKAYTGSGRSHIETVGGRCRGAQDSDHPSPVPDGAG